MAAATAAESMVFLHIVTFLITDCSADAAAQRDSTQVQSNQNSLFLSNETAIGLIWPGCATAEQNEVENRGLRQW
jgi:hypothetical protein